MNQQTIGKVIRFEGPSIVSDEPTYLTINPAETHMGIQFVRVDEPVIIPCSPANLCRQGGTKWTSLQRDGHRIEATEHILAALWGMGVTNATIEMHGSGIPLLDGSALPFVQGIQEAGIVDQEVRQVPRFSITQDFMVYEDMVDFRDGKRKARYSYITAIPTGAGMSFSFLLHYDNIALPMQFVETGKLTPEFFAKNIAPARTFMTPWEISRWAPDGPEPLLSRYFCDTVPIVSTIKVFEERIPNEAAYHKVLDMIGDLAVFGLDSGTFFGVRSGHRLNKCMIRRIRSGR